MSKYTTEVRFICENYAGMSASEGYMSVKDVIARSREKVFDFDYPIYDENYRSVLETKILKHFYTREIGSETVGLWKLWLDTRLNEIMPYYNQLYKSALLEFDPLSDTKIVTSREIIGNGSKNDNENKNINRTTVGEAKTTSNGETETTASDSTDAWKYYSDTPQGGVDGIASLRYLTNATHDTSTQNGTTNSSSESEVNSEYSDTNTEVANNSLASTFSNTEEYIEHISGKSTGGSFSKMLSEFRETFLNIDLEIIHELDDLFMNIW